MFCPECGKQLPDNAHFCSSCGNAVDFGTLTEAPTYEAPAEAPTYETPAEAPTYEAPAEAPTYETPAENSLFSAPPPSMPQELPQNEPQQPSMIITDGAAAKEKGKKLNMAVTAIIAVVFGILAFALIFVSFGAGSIRKGLKENVISGEIGNISVGGIVAGDLLSDPMFSQLAEDNGLILPGTRPERADISQIAAANIQLDGMEITAEQVDEIIEKLELNKQFSNIVKEYEHFILTGKADPDFYNSIIAEVKRLVRDSEKYIIEAVNYRLADDYEQQLDKILKDNEAQIKSLLPENSLRSISGFTGILFSPVLLIAALVLSLALAALTGIISRRVTVPFVTGGAVYTLFGVIMMISAFMLNNLAMLSAFDFVCVRELLSPFLYKAFGQNMLYGGLICTGFGVICIVTAVIINAVSSAKTPSSETSQE